MKKNIRKSLAMIVTATMITTMTTTINPAQAYAAAENARSNAYYTEVSQIATVLTAPFKDEAERQACYDCMMAGVFGGNYRPWEGNKQQLNGKNTLICVLSEAESSRVFQGFLSLNGIGKHLDFYDGNRYYCMVDRVALNGDGINERNYRNLQAAYQTAEMLKAQTAGMRTVDKARHIQDYLIDLLEYGEVNSPPSYSAFQALSTQKGVCIVYTTLFCIFGRYCGLDVGTVVYREPSTSQLHTYNTIILDNGETRCIDVTWNDSELDGDFFLETVEENLISHPR